MAFTAKDVQALREKTGCGMMDCKKALTECDGDMDKAVDFLREKGLAQQAKKASRIAAEGAVLVYEGDGVAAAVEINAETDFVAGGDLFKDLTKKVAQVVAEQNPADVEALGNCTMDGKTVNEAVQDLFLSVRENIKIRRFERFEGAVGSYVHGGGKIGVLVKFDAPAEVAATAEFKTLAKDISMQIAAANPSYLDHESVPAEVLEHEKSIMVTQMKEDPKMANKPDQVLHKMKVKWASTSPKFAFSSRLSLKTATTLSASTLRRRLRSFAPKLNSSHLPDLKKAKVLRRESTTLPMKLPAW